MKALFLILALPFYALNSQAQCQFGSITNSSGLNLEYTWSEYDIFQSPPNPSVVGPFTFLADGNTDCVPVPVSPDCMWGFSIKFPDGSIANIDHGGATGTFTTTHTYGGNCYRIVFSFATCSDFSCTIQPC